MTAPNTVLIVDDEKVPLATYLHSLEDAGFDVIHLREVDTVAGFVDENRSSIAIVLIDIMMPVGKRYSNNQTNGGLRTGLLLLKDLRALMNGVPFIVLTNVGNPETLSELEDSPDITVRAKLDTPPSKLTHLVRLAIANKQNTNPENASQQDAK